MSATRTQKKRKQSAVSKIHMTGLELVPKRKSRGKLCTIKQAAEIDFKPWTREPGMRDGELIPSAEVMTNLGVSCRMGYAIMLLSRDQLIASHGKVDHDQIDRMQASLLDAAERMKSLVQMVTAAYDRVLVSAAAAYVQGRKFKRAKKAA